MAEDGALPGGAADRPPTAVEPEALARALESEAEFRLIFEQAGIGLYQTTPDGRYLRANPALARMLGYDDPDHLMSVVTDVGRQVYADSADRARFQAEIDRHDRLDGFAVRARRRDGTVIWCQQSATLVRDPFGRPLCYVGTAIDITALIQTQEALTRAERDYRDIFENAREGIYRSSPDGRQLRANPALVRLNGYATEDEMLAAINDIGREWYVDPGRREVFRRLLDANDEITGFVSEIYRHKTRERIWISENARAVRGADGSLLYYEGTVQDITDQIRAQQGMRRAMAAAETSNRAKSEFLANMSHELRTPLNAIIGFSEVIKSETFGAVGNDRYAGYVDDIHASARHLLGLIEDILEMSKAEAGRLEVAEEPVDLAHLAGRAAHMLSERARRGGVELAVEPPDPAAPTVLRGDERRLMQVALNLIGNAVKFTPPGGKVAVRLGRAADVVPENLPAPEIGSAAPPAPRDPALVVADTGIGIPADQLSRVFEPFVQVDRPGTDPREGAGLGLALSRTLVELHGGTLALTSRPGSGTTAVARFPEARVVDG
jgi:PAS domain S-box-containing protein